MLNQSGKRFRGSFFGYNRAAVDAEFDRLLYQADDIVQKQRELAEKVISLESERSAFSKERSSMVDSVNSMSGQVLDLESGLINARSENASLLRSIEAQRAETSAMHTRFDHLRERDRDFTMREREFSELQSSVASIMSITKRATDRVFQNAVDSQERITQVAGDAAREVAAIRSDMSGVRQDLNRALDELQDRIDRVDAALTGAVHKLVAVKHSGDLQMDDNRADVLTEVERLLSMRAGDVDNSGGKGFTVPILGPYGSKFVSDTAQRVSSGQLSHNNANNNSDTGPDTGANTGGLDVRKALPGNFSSTEDSMLEARNLLDRGGVTAEEYYAQIEQLRQTPLWSDDSSDSLIAIPSDDFNADTTGSAVSQPGQTQIGFADPDTPSARTDQITADPPVSVISDISGTPGVSGMSGVSPQSYRIPPPPVLYPIQPSPQRHRINVGRPTRPSPNKPIVLKRSRRVTVRLPKRPMLVSVIRRQVLGR